MNPYTLPRETAETGISCPACDGRSPVPTLDLGCLPTQSGVLYGTRESALRAPQAPIHLAICGACGHLYNTAFDASRVPYDEHYDADLHHSAVFRRYADELARHLVSTYNLTGQTVLEIGSGSGRFLRDLLRHGVGNAIGFDPAGRSVESAQGIAYTAAAPPDFRTASFLCCRHVLEHLAEPVSLLAEIATAKLGTPLYLEVPNARWTLTESGPWDVIYPHVSYFVEESMTTLTARAGLRCLHVRTGYSGQFLMVEAVVGRDRTSVPAGLSDIVEMSRRLKAQWRSVAAWRQRLAEMTRLGADVVVWGAGSKGVTFVNLVDMAGQVSRVVDVNPAKWNKHVPGTGHQVVSPEALQDRPPTAVIVMNPIYGDEITARLARLGIRANMIVA